MMVSITKAEYEAIMFCREQVTGAIEGASDENYVKEGADLVIGPGCKVEGLQYDKAVYCRNYKEMVAKINAQNETKGLSK